MELIDQIRIMKGILDSYPYPIVFVDDTYTIRFLNRYAEYHYYQERGYGPLLGKSIFDCHDQESSKQRIRAAFEKMKKDGKEIFLKVNAGTSGCICSRCGTSRAGSSAFSSGSS